jgi:hypothetical protein
MLHATRLRGSSFVTRALFLTVLLFGGPAARFLHAQTLSSGFAFAGATFGSHPLDGAGRFGVGLDAHLASQFDLGGEVGMIFKHDAGVLGSANLSYHFTRSRRHEEWDPFLVAGVSAARFAGTGGAWINLGGGVNYWFSRRAALRGEFKGYAGGQDLGGFGEFRFGVTFRP